MHAQNLYVFVNFCLLIGSFLMESHSKPGLCKYIYARFVIPRYAGPLDRVKKDRQGGKLAVNDNHLRTTFRKRPYHTSKSRNYHVRERLSCNCLRRFVGNLIGTTGEQALSIYLCQPLTSKSENPK